MIQQLLITFTTLFQLPHKNFRGIQITECMTLLCTDSQCYSLTSITIQEQAECHHKHTWKHTSKYEWHTHVTSYVYIYILCTIPYHAQNTVRTAKCNKATCWLCTKVVIHNGCSLVVNKSIYCQIQSYPSNASSEHCWDWDQRNNWFLQSQLVCQHEAGKLKIYATSWLHDSTHNSGHSAIDTIDKVQLFVGVNASFMFSSCCCTNNSF